PHEDRNARRRGHPPGDARRPGHARDDRRVPRAVPPNGAPAPATDDVATRRRRDDVRRLGAGVTAEVRFRFEGKVAIVTGAARGVGREIVNAFVNAGARVLAADREGIGLAETCAPHGEGVTAVIADVSTSEGATSI